MRRQRLQAGITLIETVTVLLTVSALAGISLSYLGNIQRRSYDAVAESDLRNLKVAIRPEANSSDNTDDLFFSNIQGVSALPEPLNNVGLSPGVTLDYAVRLGANNPDTTTVILQLSHNRGTKVLRYVYANGNEVEQSFARGAAPSI